MINAGNLQPMSLVPASFITRIVPHCPCAVVGKFGPLATYVEQ
jgi:hypothetical protein